MALIFKAFDVALSAADAMTLRQSLQSFCFNQITIGSGVSLDTLAEYKQGKHNGLRIIGNDNKSKIIGLAYRDTQMNRTWCIEQQPNHFTLFIDGKVEVVTNLGLEYSSEEKRIILAGHPTIIVANL